MPKNIQKEIILNRTERRLCASEKTTKAVIFVEARRGAGFKEMQRQELEETLRALNVPMDSRHLTALIEARAPDPSGLVHPEAFKSIYRSLVHRPELQLLFQRLSKGQGFISSQKFLEFLQTEQCQADPDEGAVRQLIQKHELMLEARRENYMTIEGFVRFMNSEEAQILRGAHRRVYQDMGQPLNNYYISSSHNTYLLSDQVVGPSHLYAYSSALMRGCRCLEIDCWDGDEDEPVVYHGHTLTSKLLFRTVISVIGHYAFQASPYPLILSLENHCSPRQQEVMAKHLTSILGERLLTTTVPESGSRFLPSPETLIGKILVKHKKVGPTQSSAPSTPSQVGECVEQAKNTKKIKFYLKIRRKIAEPKITQVQKTELAMALSDLVIYTQSKKFISFQHSREHQKFYENNSLSEQEAKKLSRHSAQEFIQHTRNFITRIYPKGSRTDSSNFLPQEFWNVGCQMVALNFQTPGVAMDLQDGRFLDNGRCGYVLKPEYLRTEGGRFHPHAQRHRTRPMFFTIKVISGFLLPHRSFSKTNTTSLIVTVEIYGTPADEGRKQTYEVKNNAFNPQWAQSLTFSVQVPELALLRFCLEDRSPLGSSELLGQYTLPLTSLGKGYRHVPLLNKHGQSLAPACLYVHVWYP